MTYPTRKKTTYTDYNTEVSKLTIYIINGRPHVAITNGFKAIPELVYAGLIELNAIEHVEEVEIID